YPDYYEEITNPIALNEIQTKLFASGYASLDVLKRDLNLMFDNAKIYNEPDSQIYKDANTLQKMVQEFEGKELPKSAALANGRTSQKHSNTATGGSVGLGMEDTMMKIIDSLLSSVDKNGDTMFDDFRNLVSRKDYPEYYKIIKEPMSLNTIRKRILAHRYTGWSEFERDMELIIQNARTFNEEESFIVRAALELQVGSLHVSLSLAVCPSTKHTCILETI
ncbi:Bromodomain-domain-containing protein, partial [Terfezia boudieri ATCC MYA-4762]